MSDRFVGKSTTYITAGVTAIIGAIPVTSGESFALHKVMSSEDAASGGTVTTVERDRTTPEAAEIMPFGDWETAPAVAPADGPEALFRFPAPDDPAPATARLLLMSLCAAALGMVALGVGIRALLTVIGGVAFWYVPVLTFFGLLSLVL